MKGEGGVYDGLRRQTGVTVVYGSAAPIQYTATLDGAGRVLQSLRVSDGSRERFAYDALGRLTCQANALGGITSYTNVIIDNRPCVSNTYGDSGTRVETHLRDGRNGSNRRLVNGVSRLSEIRGIVMTRISTSTRRGQSRQTRR